MSKNGFFEDLLRVHNVRKSARITWIRCYCETKIQCQCKVVVRVQGGDASVCHCVSRKVCDAKICACRLSPYARVSACVRLYRYACVL